METYPTRASGEAAIEASRRAIRGWPAGRVAGAPV